MTDKHRAGSGGHLAGGNRSDPACADAATDVDGQRPGRRHSSASATTITTGWLRKTAEFDNYRKRIERERREQADQAVVDLLQELLLVVDDFDRALTVDAGGESGRATARASS